MWWRNRSPGRRPRANGSDCAFQSRTTRRRCCSRRRCTASIVMATRWREWRDQPAVGLATLLDYNGGDTADGESVREASMLCAPLVTRDSLVGVLKIAARYPEQLKPFDAELVEHFRAQAAIAIQNLHRTESLRARVVTAERKARHGGPGAERVTRREQRARVDAATDPADAGRPPQRDVYARPCLPRTSNTCRSRFRSVAGSSAEC